MFTVLLLVMMVAGGGGGVGGGGGAGGGDGPDGWDAVFLQVSVKIRFFYMLTI